MITIDKVTRRYGKLVAVREVSANIGAGEVVGLLGHNGAGKTTLMKMATGYLEPSAGRLTVGGADVVGQRLEVQRQIGYLPESAPLYPEMLVQDYLLMMARLRGVPADQVERRVAVAAARTGLGDRLVQPIANLSKGYRQRVGLAQAIVHEPRVLVLDEPTNGLDPAQIQSIRTLILELAEQATVILSTHIMQEVEAVCGRVMVMIDGSLATDAPLADLLSSDAVHLQLPHSVDGVPGVLGALDGVHGVREVEGDGDRRTWAVDGDDPATLVPRVLQAASTAGWTVLACAPEQRTLESVFRSLHDQRARAGGAA